MTQFFQLAIAGLYSLVHPFFVSMTDLNYNATSKSLEVSVRIFTDDFEKALQKSCNCKVQLNKGAEKATTEKLISTYLLQHLQLKVDGKAVKWQLAGYQQEEGSTWSYFEVTNLTSPHSIELLNTLLYEYSDEQINMVHLKANGKDQTDKLEFPERKFRFDL